VGPAGAALVAIELGGINRIPPGASAPHGGIQPTLEADPFYAYGAISQPDSGIFSVGVPSERLGVHVYARGFYCGLPDAGPVEPEDGTVTILPLPLAAPDGGTLPQEPSISGFSAVPDVVFPGETITIEANVEAAAPELDPLSAQVVAIEPISGWAGVLAPPTPGTWGKGYPNGVYSRLVYAPNVPGEYVYYLVAATQACVVSKPASVRILVSETGEGGIEADGTPAD
jgi:hypothetical protein